MYPSCEDIQLTDEGYDVATEYLTEVNELKDQLDGCQQKLIREKNFLRSTQNVFEQLSEKIADLQGEVFERDEEIEMLKSRYHQLSTRDPSKLQPPSMFTSKFVDPDEIAFKTRNLLVQIHQDHEESHKSGKHEKIDERIAEVRDLFNLLLLQLNNLFHKNKALSRTLDALTKLDKSEITLHTIKRGEVNMGPEIKITTA